MTRHRSRCDTSYEFTCDSALSPNCEGEIEFTNVSFYQALTELREAGWRSHEEGGEWRDTCPGCLDHAKSKRNKKFMKAVRDEQA